MIRILTGFWFSWWGGGTPPVFINYWDAKPTRAVVSSLATDANLAGSMTRAEVTNNG